MKGKLGQINILVFYARWAVNMNCLSIIDAAIENNKHKTVDGRKNNFYLDRNGGRK